MLVAISTTGWGNILVCPDARELQWRTECLPHRSEMRTDRLLLLIFSMWVSWQLFFGPGTEQLTYGIIAPSASWAVIVSFDEKRARWLTVTAWAMLALFSSGDVENARAPGISRRQDLAAAGRRVVRRLAPMARTRTTPTRAAIALRRSVRRTVVGVVFYPLRCFRWGRHSCLPEKCRRSGVAVALPPRVRQCSCRSNDGRQ